MTAGGRASAGPQGDRPRSDARVEVEPRDSGGLEVCLTSKVELLYGAAIRRQLEEGARALGLEHALLTVVDGGAMPFVLDARLEAATRALGLDVGAGLLPDMQPEQTEPSPRDRFRRSRLYLPGSQPKFMISAGLYGADALILDLEDSVAPPEKAAARVLVRNALRFLDWGRAERMVRINQLPAGLDDLEFLVGHGVQMILIPKVESPDEVVAVAERAAALAGGAAPPWLMPILESGRGVFAAEAIASAHPTVAALTIGLEDYTADVGARRTVGGRESFWARSALLAAAASAGVQAIDSVFSDLADPEGLAESVREARDLGFVGKGCIHPKQIPVVHEGFAPDPADVDRARKIVLAFEDAQARGLGVVSLGSKMIDPPVVKRALRTVEIAVRAGLLDPDWKERGKETSDA